MTIVRIPLGAKENVLPETFEAYTYRVNRAIINTQKLAQMGISLPIEYDVQPDPKNKTVYDKVDENDHTFLNGTGYKTVVIDVKHDNEIKSALFREGTSVNRVLTAAIDMIAQANKVGIMMRSNIFDYVEVEGQIKVFGAFLSTEFTKGSKYADYFFLWKSCALFMDEQNAMFSSQVNTVFLEFFRQKPEFQKMTDETIIVLRDASLHARELLQWSILPTSVKSLKIDTTSPYSTKQIVGITTGVIAGLTAAGAGAYFLKKKYGKEEEE